MAARACAVWDSTLTISSWNHVGKYTSYILYKFRDILSNSFWAMAEKSISDLEILEVKVIAQGHFFLMLYEA